MLEDSKIFNSFDREWDICPVKLKEVDISFGDPMEILHVNDVEDTPPRPPALAVDPNPEQLPDDHWGKEMFPYLGSLFFEDSVLKFDEGLDQILFTHFSFHLYGSILGRCSMAVTPHC